MLASRLLSILLMLQARGRISAGELAAHFEVSVRTIHRDIDQLSAAGIPVYAERGRGGGFALLDGYRTKLTGLTRPEAETLFLAGLPGPAMQLGLAENLAAAQLKLMAALPAHIQPEADRIAQRFHLDPTAWFRAADAQDALPVVARAVWNAQMLTLRYRRAREDEARPRRLGPLGLVLKGGLWYLVAQNGGAIRTYRVASIFDAVATDELFARPRDFDLPAYWEQASRQYETSLYLEHAEVRLSADGMTLLKLLNPQVEEAARQTATPDGDGWTRCRLPIESTEDGVREMMRLGAEVEVLGPPALRERIAATLAAASRYYRTS